MNGTLRLPLNRNSFYTVFGGPYKERPLTMKGVNMAIELPLSCDISIPTKDFSVPNDLAMTFGLQKAVTLLLKGYPVYVGCFGGIGRTGIFLAILAKAFGCTDPIQYVRQNYMPRAVERKMQEEFVNSFPIPTSVKLKIALARVRYFFRSGNLTVVNYMDPDMVD